jgi:hypothetical protein
MIFDDPNRKYRASRAWPYLFRDSVIARREEVRSMPCPGSMRPGS